MVCRMYVMDVCRKEEESGGFQPLLLSSSCSVANGNGGDRAPAARLTQLAHRLGGDTALQTVWQRKKGLSDGP